MSALATLLCLSYTACTWEPDARPVQPERLASGKYQVIGMLDLSRYASVARLTKGTPRVAIVDLRRGTLCDFPADTLPITGVIKGPTGETDPPFLWPAVHVLADGTQRLTFSDPECGLREADLTVSDNIYPFTLDEDQRQVLLAGDGKGTLSLYDPWLEELTEIARNVALFQQAARPQGANGPVGPQLLWVIENGELTLRTLEGELLLRRGKNVSGITQAAFASLRIAYVDDGDLYEAVAPNFVPALVAQDACDAVYGGATLSYYTPCADRQLVRLDLSTGERETFADGVFYQWEQDGFQFERAIDAQNVSVLFVTPPGGKRTQVEPTLFADVQALDSTRIVGQDAESTFGIWSASDGFTPLLKKAGPTVGFIDTRTNRLSWIAMHDIKDGSGTLSYLEQPSFRLETIAKNVATNSLAVQQISTLAEPVMFYVRDAKVTISEASGQRFNGSLDARVLSGDLASNIGEHITSYAVVPDPNVAGLLYTTEGPEDQGLWFAAL